MIPACAAAVAQYNTYSTHYRETDCLRQMTEPFLYNAGVDIVLHGVHADLALAAWLHEGSVLLSMGGLVVGRRSTAGHGSTGLNIPYSCMSGGLSASQHFPLCLAPDSPICTACASGHVRQATAHRLQGAVRTMLRACGHAPCMHGVAGSGRWVTCAACTCLQATCTPTSAPSRC